MQIGQYNPLRNRDKQPVEPRIYGRKSRASMGKVVQDARSSPLLQPPEVLVCVTCQGDS